MCSQLVWVKFPIVEIEIRNPSNKGKAMGCNRMGIKAPGILNHPEIQVMLQIPFCLLKEKLLTTMNRSVHLLYFKKKTPFKKILFSSLFIYLFD